MLQKVKQYTENALARAMAIIVFMIALPLSLTIALFLLITGATALVITKYGLRKAGANLASQHTSSSAATPAKSDPLRDPIEGSYTVVNSSAATETNQGT